jgi:hypothetical protein
MFDPHLITASRRHAAVYAGYQQIYALVDSGAAIAFVVGSVFFLDEEMKRWGEWLFLIGSVLFAFVPMVAILQGLHLDRISTTSLSTPRKNR